MKEAMLAGADFALAIAYAVLYLGTRSRFFRIFYFGCAVLCMVAGVTLLI